MSNLALRFLSAFILIPPVLCLVFFSPHWLFCLSVAVVASLCGFEFGTISFGPSFSSYRFLPAVFSFLASLSIPLYLFHPLSSSFFLAVLLVFIPTFFMFVDRPLKETLPISLFSISGSLYCGILFGFISLLYISKSNGSYWVFSLLLATFFGDTLAYTFGRIFGRRKLAPRISPGKTWAGAFGGLFGSLLALSLAKLFLMTNLSWFDVPLIAIPLNIACQLGDLAESFLKRAFEVKDSGSIIPGHGGVLDRVDALMFGAPVLFFLSVMY